MRLGDNIAKFRINKGWTQADLAEAAKLSRGYVAAIEEGRVTPKLKTLVVIAHSLGVELDQIREGD